MGDVTAWRSGRKSWANLGAGGQGVILQVSVVSQGGKTGKAEAEPIKALREENVTLRAELSAYADRTKVLERIVTDKGYDVGTQIEALRDARRTEALIDNREQEVRF